MIDTSIARIQGWLSANRPDYFASLQPGVTADQLRAFEETFSLKLPAEFCALYEWRNGQNADSSASLQNNRMFSSLEEITQAKKMMDEMIGYDFDDPKWWRRTWVPFLSNGGGDHLCIDLAAEDGGQPGQIICFWHDWEDRSIKYASLEAWALDLATSMEDGTLELV